MKRSTALILGVTLAAACATAPDAAKSHGPDDGSSGALRYDDTWERGTAVDRVKQEYFERFEYDSDFRVSDVDGAELAQLVEERGRSEFAPELAPLVGKPDARFVVIEAPAAHPYMPPAVVITVPPTDGPDEVLAAANSDKATFYLGVMPLDEALQTPNAKNDQERSNRRLRALVLAPTLAGKNLEKFDFSTGDFSGMSFAGSNLKGATFQNADLERADLTGADLTGADISQARTPGANWADAICPDGRKAEDRGGHCLPELEYGDFQEQKERFTDGHSRFLREEYDYDGEIDARMINGQELFELEQKHGDALMFPGFYPVVHHPDAQILVLEFEPHVRAPAAVVYVFTPETGIDEAIRERLPKGFTSIIGRKSLWSYPNPEAPDRPEIDYEVAQESGKKLLTKLEADEIRTKMSAGESFTVVITANGCGAVPRMLAMLGALPEPESYSGKIIDLEARYETPEMELAEELAGEVVFPSLVFIRDGRVVAKTVGAQDYATTQNRLAHHFGRPHLDWVHRKTVSTNDSLRAAELTTIAGLRSFDDENLDGQNLSGAYMRHMTLTNTSLRNADLSGADLRDSTLSYADLSGANLSGAKVEGALWYKTTCPDGKSSEDHGGACPVP